MSWALSRQGPERWSTEGWRKDQGSSRSGDTAGHKRGQHGHPREAQAVRAPCRATQQPGTSVARRWRVFAVVLLRWRRDAPLMPSASTTPSSTASPRACWTASSICSGRNESIRLHTCQMSKKGLPDAPLSTGFPHGECAHTSASETSGATVSSPRRMPSSNWRRSVASLRTSSRSFSSVACL